MNNCHLQQRVGFQWMKIGSHESLARFKRVCHCEHQMTSISHSFSGAHGSLIAMLSVDHGPITLNWLSYWLNGKPIEASPCSLIIEPIMRPQE